MRTWEDLSEIDREVMLLAGEEAMLWAVCAALEPDPGRRDAHVLAESQRIAGSLASDGLLWFYRLDPDKPALTASDVVDLFNDAGSWLRDESRGTAANSCLFATEDGERLLTP